MSNRHDSEVRTIHPRALKELGEEACIVALGVARDLRSGVIPAREFDMTTSCGSVCCIAGHIAGRMYLSEAKTAYDFEGMQTDFFTAKANKSRGLYSLFAGDEPSDPILAADAIERYVYDGSETPWKT